MVRLADDSYHSIHPWELTIRVIAWLGHECVPAYDWLVALWPFYVFVSSKSHSRFSLSISSPYSL